jgi:hypothetical protein
MTAEAAADGASAVVPERSGSPPDRRVVVLTTAAEVEALARRWDALDPHPNARPDAFLAVVRSRPAIVGPYVVAMLRGDTIEGLLVGRLEDVAYRCNFANRTLLKPRVRSITVVYGGAIRTGPDVPWEPMLGALTAALRAGTARTVLLRKQEAGSDLMRAIRSVTGPAWRNESDPPEIHWRLDLPSRFDELLGRVGRHARGKLRRYRKTLDRDFPGKVVVRKTTDPAGVAEFCRRAETVAQGTYQRGLGQGFVHTPEYEARLLAAARHGWLRAYDLEVDGRVRSFWITERSGDTLHVESTGYEREFSKHEPGTVVLLQLLEDAIAEGVRQVDYGFGDAQYKRRFDAVSSQESDVYLFAPGIRGLVLNGARGGIAWAGRCADAVVTKTGLKDRLRRSMRESARERAAEGGEPSGESGQGEEGS